DHGDGPERVVGQEGEVGEDADPGNPDAGDLTPGLAGQDPQRNGDSDGAHDDVDPAPGGQVDLVDVVLAGDEDVVLGRCGDPLKHRQGTEDQQHDAGEAGDGDRGREVALTVVLATRGGGGHRFLLDLDGDGVGRTPNARRSPDARTVRAPTGHSLHPDRA